VHGGAGVLREGARAPVLEVDLRRRRLGDRDLS
jgi:hypothetical protein